MVYPLAFLYRQGIELSLKHLCRSPGRTGETPALTHGLSENWKVVRPLLEAHNDDHPANELAAVQLDSIELLLKDFEAIDAASMVFRYPAGKKGDLYLQDQSRIDVL